ncbi:MAG: translation factor Sua5, partial [Zoogloeaceae bacterium]|nr:translation factor Sua5 [Zoogloeaceae bacterium]
STIVDCSRGAPVVLRPGHITPADLDQIVSAPSAPMEKHRRPPGPPRVSGSLSSHYAPKTPAVLVPANALTTFLAAHPGCAVLPLTDDPEGYARELYAALRRLDACRAPCIAIEAPPEGPRWQAVHDRLRRATHHGT